MTENNHILDGAISAELQDSNSLLITETEGSFLIEASKWAKFLGILGFISTGFVVLGALFVLVGSAVSGNGGLGLLGALFYAGFGLLYFLPSLYLFKFSVKIRTAIYNVDQYALSESMEFLKKYFKFVGILIIVLIALYILMMIGLVMFGLTGASLLNNPDLFNF